MVGRQIFSIRYTYPSLYRLSHRFTESAIAAVYDTEPCTKMKSPNVMCCVVSCPSFRPSIKFISDNNVHS